MLSNIRRVNRLFDDIEMIKTELKARTVMEEGLACAAQQSQCPGPRETRDGCAVGRAERPLVLKEIVERKEYPQRANAVAC